MASGQPAMMFDPAKPQNHATPVPATHLHTVEQVLASDIPGAYCLTETHLSWNCPCGCGSFSQIPVGPDSPRGWRWDLEMPPTITPSIRQLNHCKYHGFLTAGVWTFCGDSGR